MIMKHQEYQQGNEYLSTAREHFSCKGIGSIGYYKTHHDFYYFVAKHRSFSKDVVTSKNYRINKWNGFIWNENFIVYNNKPLSPKENL